VRWYLRFNLSYRDVEELLVERGVEVDHVTVYRWVQRFTPLLAATRRVTGGTSTRPMSRHPMSFACQAAACRSCWWWAHAVVSS
jgi:hypothetical protein